MACLNLLTHTAIHQPSVDVVEVVRDQQEEHVHKAIDQINYLLFARHLSVAWF